MLSISECKKILHDNGLAISESKVSELRDFLYSIAELDFQLLRMKYNAKVDNIYKGFN